MALPEDAEPRLRGRAEPGRHPQDRPSALRVQAGPRRLRHPRAPLHLVAHGRRPSRLHGPVPDHAAAGAVRGGRLLLRGRGRLDLRLRQGVPGPAAACRTRLRRHQRRGPLDASRRQERPADAAGWPELPRACASGRQELDGAPRRAGADTPFGPRGRDRPWPQAAARARADRPRAAGRSRPLPCRSAVGSRSVAPGHPPCRQGQGRLGPIARGAVPARRPAARLRGHL